jgi:RNA polymerase-binding transcription factor DksA
MKTRTENGPDLEILRNELEIEGGRLLLEANDRPELPYVGYEPASFDDELAASLSLETRARLSDVKSALDRIDAGTFGACDSCGADIGERELETHPWANQCARCQRPLVTPYKHPRTRRAAARTRTFAV